METELAALAASGATTVVGLMATDGWIAVRSRVVALLRRGGRAKEDADLEDELDQECSEATAAREDGDATAIADLEAVWRTRLRRLLREDPAAATALRELIAESNPAPGAVHNIISGGEFHQAVIQWPAASAPRQGCCPIRRYSGQAPSRLDWHFTRT